MVFYYTMILPFLPVSLWFFLYVLSCRKSFLVGSSLFHQWCSADHCDFGVLVGGGELRITVLHHLGRKILKFQSPQASETKEKINKSDCIKLKSFCIVKDTFNKKKRQSTEWEKIFANDISVRGFISKIYEEFMQLNIKKLNNLIQKVGRGLE